MNGISIHVPFGSMKTETCYVNKIKMLISTQGACLASIRTLPYSKFIQPNRYVVIQLVPLLCSVPISLHVSPCNS